MKLKQQKIYSAFFRETKTFYKIEDLKKLLKSSTSEEITLEHAKDIYQKLLDENVIKPCTKKQFDLNELNEDEISKKEEEAPSIVNSNDKGFFFRFVGVVYIDDCVLKIYPKYIDLNTKDISSPYDFENADKSVQEEINNHLKKVLRVIKKITKDSQAVSLNNENKEKFNHIGMQIFLLEDYYKNGIYQNIENIIETNGEGEIDWDKTINETTAIIKNKNPYYVELQTINTRSNEFDYFKLLHESILCECSRNLRDTDLLEYLGMIPCELTGMELSTFGDVSYIKYRLQQEIRTQFITRKRNQLISLLTYITEETGKNYSNTLKLYGSYHFEHIWEVVCKAVFDDLYNNEYRIDNSVLKSSPSLNQLLDVGIIKKDTEPDRINPKNNFKDLIEKVEWNMNGISCSPDGNLAPDLICIDEQENFYVLDAKYYIVKVNEETKQIQNNPGIQDVLKQFAYERAYKDLLRDFRFFETVNAFLMPTVFSDWGKRKSPLAYRKGEVTYELMQQAGFRSLGPIQVLEIEPDYIFKKFLNSEVCLHELTKFLETNKLLHNINRCKNGANPGKEMTLVGFMRMKYVKQIQNGNSFYFYFYEVIRNYEVQIHPEILRCTKFIGLCKEDSIMKKICGTLIPEIKRVTKSELKDIITKSGIKEYEPTHEIYYCMKVLNPEVKDISNSEYDEIKQKVDKGAGNHLLSQYSPKVIEL